MDETTKQIVGQVTGVLIQSIFSYLAQVGLTPDEMDDFFNEQRAEFKRKHPDTLPPPDVGLSIDPPLDE